MFEFDAYLDTSSSLSNQNSEPHLQDDNDEEKSDEHSTTQQNDKSSPVVIFTGTNETLKFFDHFAHIIQFCHLCAKWKIPPVPYSHHYHGYW
jgi:hypothetical protein